MNDELSQNDIETFRRLWLAEQLARLKKMSEDELFEHYYMNEDSLFG